MEKLDRNFTVMQFANRPKRTQFWGVHIDDDSLVIKVLSGEKTATVCKADEYLSVSGEFDDGDMQVDDVIDVHDLRGNFRCTIRITEVYPVRFGHIPEKLWRAECCKSEDHFRDVHRKAWSSEQIDDGFEMIATHFRLSDDHD